ncbi:MAG: GIY-YIG nuclease family protein [Cloacibacillus evryensis]
MNKEELIKFVKGFPDKPGVYLMRDEHGDIIYIGKAKSLKKRVSSYFRHSNFASPRLRKLVATIRDISTMRTESEIEALILENRLIKLYQPFFNVDLKMNERYAYIKITAEKYLRIVVTRIKLSTTGPSTSAPMCACRRCARSCGLWSVICRCAPARANSRSRRAAGPA